MQESEKWKWSRSGVSDSLRSHGLQPTRLLHPWDFPGKSTGVGCHCLLRFKLLFQNKEGKPSQRLFGSPFLLNEVQILWHNSVLFVMFPNPFSMNLLLITLISQAFTILNYMKFPADHPAFHHSVFPAWNALFVTFFQPLESQSSFILFVNPCYCPPHFSSTFL